MAKLDGPRRAKENYGVNQCGDLHIHDLEYFGTRPFCADSDLRYLFYYGLIPSGDAATSAVARPAINAEVAILHAVKWMGSAQTNFAGGQGFYNFLTFLAPYLSNLTYPEIKQLMQMFVARSGKTVFLLSSAFSGCSKDLER